MLIQMKFKSKTHKCINMCEWKSVQTNPLLISSKQEEFLLDGIIGGYSQRKHLKNFNSGIFLCRKHLFILSINLQSMASSVWRTIYPPASDFLLLLLQLLLLLCYFCIWHFLLPHLTVLSAGSPIDFLQPYVEPIHR